MKKSTLTPETDNSEQSQSSEPPLTAGKLLLKSTLLSLVFVGILLIITAVGVGIFAYTRFTTFLQTAGLTQKQVKNYIDSGLQTTIPNKNGVTTFLLLGIDSVANKAEAPILTDTMMLVSLNQNTGKITTMSLPRDLWSKEYKTKINALYVYGETRYPGTPERFTREVIEEMTGVDVDYTMVVSLNMLAELVDTLGGISVDVPNGFTDTEFPRSDIDIALTTNPQDFYQTVTFEAGEQTMSGEQVLQYVRSRHSQGDTGTDVDRNARQQLVISAIAEKLAQKETYLDPTMMGKIYKWYVKYVQKTFPENDVVAFIKLLYPYKDTVSIESVPVTIYPDIEYGIIEHPPVQQTDNQWVYTVRDAEAFKNYFEEHLLTP